MAKINPFHTNSPEYPREVYHDTNTCPDGKRIKPEHRQDGTGNKKHCLECQKEEHRHHHHPEHPPKPPERPPGPPQPPKPPKPREVGKC